MSSVRFLLEDNRSLTRGGNDEGKSPRQAAGGETCVPKILLCFVGAVMLSTLLLGGCDTSVQPFVSSDEYRYSIYGILDPAQDTQWVRVEPLVTPTSSGVPDESLDVTVTLESTATGQTWTLRDSLFEVFRDEFQHNFWTTAPISPGATYRLTVRNAEGESTSAATTTPQRPPSLETTGNIRLPCTSPPESNRFEVVLTEVDKLAALRMRYYQSLYGPPATFEFDHYDDVSKLDDGYGATINYFQDLQSARQTPARNCIADSAKVIVAAGGPDWPEWGRYRDATVPVLARPDTFTNVEGGLGTLAGVYTDTAEVRIDRGAQR